MTTAVARGIDRLLRLDYPSDTSELGLKRHYGKTVNALEMIDALEVLRSMFNDTRRIEKPMYRGEKEFDFVHDLKQAIQSYFFESRRLFGEDEKAGILRKRKNRSMVSLLLVPIVHEFQNSTHEEALKAYDALIDDAIATINEHEKDASADDAFVIQHVISNDVARRNRTQAAVDGILRLRRRKRRRKNK
jgi:hypothetical protein